MCKIKKRHQNNVIQNILRPTKRFDIRKLISDSQNKLGLIHTETWEHVKTGNVPLQKKLEFAP